MKTNLYRVELFNDNYPIKGMCSDFGNHQNLDSATNWAINRGKQGNASYVRLYRKLANVYNHYEFVDEISLTYD